MKPPGVSPTASCECGSSLLPQEGSQKGEVARELALPGGVSSQQQGYFNPQKGYQLKHFR